MRLFRSSLWILSLAASCLAPLSATSTFTSVSLVVPGSGGSPFPVTGTFNCVQSGTSSASCSDSYGSAAPFEPNGEGDVSASAAFGSLSSGAYTVGQRLAGPNATAESWFSDDVLVTGGTGSGTLISHYALAIGAQASPYVYASSSGFAFVQGGTNYALTPAASDYTFVSNPQLAPQGCAYGICFSESLDVSSPIQFGSLVPLGALSYLTSTDFAPWGGGDAALDVDPYSNLDLTGFTVLDASGSVVADALVTPQNIPDLDLFPAPEPFSGGLALLGFIGLMSFGLRTMRAGVR
jgi:hypothetical protein